MHFECINSLLLTVVKVILGKEHVVKDGYEVSVWEMVLGNVESLRDTSLLQVNMPHTRPLHHWTTLQLSQVHGSLVGTAIVVALNTVRQFDWFHCYSCMWDMRTTRRNIL